MAEVYDILPRLVLKAIPVGNTGFVFAPGSRLRHAFALYRLRLSLFLIGRRPPR